MKFIATPKGVDEGLLSDATAFLQMLKREA
jgi:hypothetical protein